METFTIAALFLMSLAVLGSLAPAFPGALLSVAGILVYWHGTGYRSPGTLFLAGFITTALVAVVFDWFGGAVAAKAGGASNKTGLAAGAAAVLGLFVLGPPGILLGVAGTVAAREYLRTGEAGSSVKASAYSTAAVLSSALVQLVVTTALLLAFIIALII